MPSDRRQRLIIAAALVAGLVVFDTWDPQGQTAGATRWYKGNTHTHTLNSDGDSTPDDVVRASILEQVYEWPLVVSRDPAVGAPTLVPLRRTRKQ